MVTQIRRAALSVYLNVAEGFSRKSECERKGYFEVARGSVIEIDAALDPAEDLGYIQVSSLSWLGTAMVQCFKLFCRLIECINPIKNNSK